MSSSDVKRPSARQQGQTLDREIRSRVKEVQVASVTSASSHRPQVERLQTNGVLMGLSRAFFSMPNNIWVIALLKDLGKIASFWP
jgi:hypothetical protein